MRPRRPSRRDRHRATIQAVQLIRLEGLLTGEYTPGSPREAMYLDLRRRGLRVDIGDFVLSPALFLLEGMLPDLEPAPEDETFTDPAEPAIPRP